MNQIQQSPQDQVRALRVILSAIGGGLFLAAMIAAVYVVAGLFGSLA